MPASRSRRLTFDRFELILLALAVALAGGALGQAVLLYRLESPRAVRQALYDELQPVSLSNCTLERLGEANDGGYLVCGNLLEGASAGYSYGISGYDGWGCDLSRRLAVPVHQYDCFDLRAPVCEGGQTQFHGECVAATAFRDESGRPFDTIRAQLNANGDANRQVILKIDVEGAEWESFAMMEPETLRQIDQLVVEFHGLDDPRFTEVIRKLKLQFEVVHLHYNNATCNPLAAPHPSPVYEVLFVSKRLAVVDPNGRPPVRPHLLDAPNVPTAHDCQN